MAIFSPPKTFTDVEIPPEDFNALFDAAMASINNIDDSQFSATADIDGDKITDGSVPTARINDATLAVGKLAVDVASVGSSVESLSSPALPLVVSTSQPAAQVQRSVLGGMVMVLGIVTVFIELNGASETNDFEAWLEKDGVQLGSDKIPFKIGGWVAGEACWITVPVLWIETVAEGLHTWTVNVEHTAGASSAEIRDRQLLVWERR